MKHQILFKGKNKKNISVCRLLKILLRVLSIKIVVAGLREWGIKITVFQGSVVHS